jgi:hypothetical protein
VRRSEPIGTTSSDFEILGYSAMLLGPFRATEVRQQRGEDEWEVDVFLCWSSEPCSLLPPRVSCKVFLVQDFGMGNVCITSTGVVSMLYTSVELEIYMPFVRFKAAFIHVFRTPSQTLIFVPAAFFSIHIFVLEELLEESLFPLQLFLATQGLVCFHLNFSSYMRMNSLNESFAIARPRGVVMSGGCKHGILCRHMPPVCKSRKPIPFARKMGPSWNV